MKVGLYNAGACGIEQILFLGTVTHANGTESKQLKTPLTSINEISQTGEGRQRSPATGFKKPRKQSLSGGLVIFYFFFYFSVALVVRGEKSPQLRAFSRQPARQRDSNGVGNRL